MPAVRYEFKQLGNVPCFDIAQACADLLVGTVAVSTSWDSGRYSRSDWQMLNGYAYSPPLSRAFIADWPVSHNAFCDEWWIFDDVVPTDFQVTAFCNYTNMKIDDYKQLDFDGGVRLDQYLMNFSPLAMFGSNECGYIVEKA